MTRSILLLAALALGAAGCGGATGICDDICDCTGDCTDNDRDECKDEVEDAQKFAEDEDCGSEFNDYSSCVSSEFECRDGEVDIDGCDSEGRDLADCLD
jgi:hypothetical protein